jgi:FixJ family two-component response regulator
MKRAFGTAKSMVENKHTPGTSPTVIVVEDDSSMRGAIKRILRAGGFVAIAYESAEAALTANGVTADCLVLDIGLPGMSGLEMYRQVIRSGANPPVIFITAHDEPAIRNKVSSMNCIGTAWYLPKPFSGRMLLDVVSRLVSVRK